MNRSGEDLVDPFGDDYDDVAIDVAIDVSDFPIVFVGYNYGYNYSYNLENILQSKKKTEQLHWDGTRVTKPGALSLQLGLESRGEMEDPPDDPWIQGYPHAMDWKYQKCPFFGVRTLKIFRNAERSISPTLRR